MTPPTPMPPDPDTRHLPAATPTSTTTPTAISMTSAPPIDLPPPSPATLARLREATQHQRRVATYNQLLASLPRTTPHNPPAQPTLYSDTYSDTLEPSRHAPHAGITADLRFYVRPRRTPVAPPDPAPSDDDDRSTASSPMPSLIDASSSDDDDYFNRDPTIPDDALNAINRSYARMQSRSPYAPPGQQLFDIRVATNESDSTKHPSTRTKATKTASTGPNANQLPRHAQPTLTPPCSPLPPSHNGPSASNHGIDSA